MGIHVVFDVPARQSARRLSASAASVVGVLLMGLGLVGVCAVVAVAIVLSAGVGLGYVARVANELDPEGRWAPDWIRSSPVPDPGSLVDPGVRLGIGLVASLVVMWLGLAVLRRRRHAVLFLRRFGYDDATRIVTAALAVLGRSWRVVTLDDSDVQAVGARRSAVTTFSREATRSVSRVAGPVVGAVVVIAVVVAGRAADTASDPASVLPAGLLDDTPVRIESPVQLATAVVLALLAATVLTEVLRRLLFPAVLLSRRVERSVQTAEGAARQSVTHEEDIETVGRLVERMTRRVFSPQLMVVASTNALWRAAVTRLLASTEVTLVDVSRPTESLLWEIRELSAHDDGRCVYIGHVDRLAGFVPEVARTAPPSWNVPALDTFPAPPGSIVEQVERVLEGHDVLAYSSDPATVPAFSRSLERHLWATLVSAEPRLHSAQDRAPTA